MAANLAQERLKTVEGAQQDIEYATATLEEAIVAGVFRNDSPELVKALSGLRQAGAAVRDLEIFTRSTMRELP